MRSSRERRGKFTVTDSDGEATEYPLELATWRPAPYRPAYRAVWPEYQNVPGEEGRVAGDPQIRQWHIDEWSGGEGEDLWQADNRYNISQDTRPKPVGDGLILGVNQSETDNAAAGTFNDGWVFGPGLGYLWTGRKTNIYYWDATGSAWSSGWATGVSTYISSICDAGDSSHMLVTEESQDSVRAVNASGNSAVIAVADADQVVVNYSGSPYLLVNDDLWRITPGTWDLTQAADLSGSSAVYRAALRKLHAAKHRISVSDVGPIWIQRLDDGQTLLWEYNQANDTDYVTGRLPVDWAMPYDIGFANGFTFVAFRYAAYHAAAGDAYLYFQRGLQRGVAGPLRSLSGTTAGKPIYLGGTIGDDLIIYYDGAVWAYNTTEGGYYMMATSGTSAPEDVSDLRTYGKDIFLGNHDDLYQVERFDTTLYTTNQGYWRSGRYDFGYLGVTKTLLDVRVVTEPLPSGTTITLSVSANGGAFQSISGTFTGDGSTTRYTWPISTYDSSITGEDFEIRLDMQSTSSSVTPTVRSITTRATGAERQRMWILETDAGTRRTSAGGWMDPAKEKLSDGRAVMEKQGVVRFTNPWDRGEYEDDDLYDVVIEQMILVPPDDEGDPIIQWQLRERGYT